MRHADHGSWDDAPCGLLTLAPDGTVLRANRLLWEWTGRSADEVLGSVRLSGLLSVGGRIYWETHLAPLLAVEGRVDEVAVELKVPGGRLPVLLTAVVDGDRVHAAISSARDRMSYERELLAARVAAERSAGQLQALQATTAALSQAVGVTGVAHALLAAAVGPLGAASATLWLADEDERLVVHGAAAEPAVPLPASGVLLRERSAGVDGDRTVVPLHGQSALRGVLSLAPRTDAAADPLDREVLTAVGQQAGLALDRAQLYEQSASVARELQHSLLAGEPPSDARFSVATVYRPGVELLDVGGDFYDVFLAAEGVLAVVVGDVVGRGLAAASAMGQLRSAVRAVAGPDIGPARLLTRLDRFVEQVEAAGMATLAYAELDLATGVLRYACAGHPPPLLLRTERDAELLWEGRSTPLGGFVRPLERPEAEVQLAPGDRLMLYTDGLFERRDRGLDEGLDLVALATDGSEGLPLDDAVRSVTTRLLADESSRDDVCVLLLQWTAGDFDRHLAADLTGLSHLRHDLTAWLLHHDVAPTIAEDLVLATSEALANAAEHGSGLHPDERVHLRVRLTDRAHDLAEVVVQVADRGRWRTGTSSHERGRGLAIIKALVDDVTVEERDGTRVVLRRRLTS